MSRRMRRASPLSIVLSAALVIATIAGFGFTRHTEAQQEHTLLQSDAGQAALYAGSAFNQVSGLLDSLATGVTLSNGDPKLFVQRAAAFAQGGALSLVLARHQGSGYEVVAAAGPGFTTGQALGPAVSSTLGRAGSQLTPTQVVFDGHRSTAGFAVGPPLVPAGLAVYLQITINPFIKTQATASKSFSMLNAALYGAPTPKQSALLVATTDKVPLQGDVAVAHTTVGASTWTLAASARSTLTGGLADAAPYLVLGLGLILALSVGITVEVLDRRRRYAAALVAERTNELERSLAELRDAQAALVRGERLTALGAMASVVGHELRNPLAAVTNALFLLRHGLGDPPDPQMDKHLSLADREVAKAASLADDLVAFVRPREPQLEPVELRDVVHEVLEATPAPSQVDVDVDVDPVLVQADRRQLAEVLTNLVTNAYQAVGDAGTVRISGHLNGAGAVLRVEDSGPGVDESVSEKIFEPFFTTKHDGTGLGLAIVRRLVEAHSGEVTLGNRQDAGGAQVTVVLPLAERTVTA